MTIGFQTKWPKSMGLQDANKPNYFPEKVIAGLDTWDHKKMTLNDLLAEVQNPSEAEFLKGNCNPLFNHKPKLHTIRKDEKDRWKVGMKIHPVINNRTKRRFQFAPKLEVKSIQRFAIVKEGKHPCGHYHKSFNVLIDQENDNVAMGSYQLDKNGNEIYCSKFIQELAINDGFETVAQFFSWFNKDFTGKIIHWTDLKY